MQPQILGISGSPIKNSNTDRLVGRMIGKKIVISGMVLEIVSDDGDRWETRNVTTRETVFMEKKTLQDAIKLGKAEEISAPDDKG